jgi:hypothetical protein
MIGSMPSARRIAVMRPKWFQYLDNLWNTL